MSVSDDIYGALDSLGIKYDLAKHDLANTMDDLRQVEARMNAVIPKNLFLTPRNKSAYYLCLTSPDAVFRTADISKQIGSSRLSFADDEAVKSMLLTHAGAISPMGLLFDKDTAIRLLIDKRLLSAKRLGFHPNDNTQTLVMSNGDFFNVFLPSVGHKPTFVSFSPTEAELPRSD